MSIPAADAARLRTRTTSLLLGAAAVGGAVSLSLAVYTRLHEPTGQPITTFGFPSVIAMKAWLGTTAAGLVVVQVLSAVTMWGRLPGVARPPGWVAPLHRWSGTAAFVVSLPVAYHCLWALGVQTTTGRVLVHSVVGIAFYGAFTTKLLTLRIRSTPGWVMPFYGALLATSLVVVWWTSSLWFFRNFGSGL